MTQTLLQKVKTNFNLYIVNCNDKKINEDYKTLFKSFKITAQTIYEQMTKNNGNEPTIGEENDFQNLTELRSQLTKPPKQTLTFFPGNSPYDGNCIFHSIRTLLANQSIITNAKTLRKNTAEYGIKTAEEHLNGTMSKEALKQAWKNMKKDKVWNNDIGDQIPQMIASSLSIPLVIIDVTERRTTVNYLKPENNENKYDKKLLSLILHRKGQHYTQTTIVNIGEWQKATKIFQTMTKQQWNYKIYKQQLTI